MFLTLYLLFTGIVVLGVHLTNRVFDAQIEQAVAAGVDREEVQKRIDEQREKAMVDRFGDADLVGSIKDVPLSVLSIFSISLFWLPLYIMLLGFDQVSGEVGPRSIRFITVRARRGAILVGKFTGQALLLIALLMLVMALFFVYSQFAFKEFSFALATVTFVRFAIASVTFSLAWLALSTLSSTAFRTPVVSLVANFIIMLVFLLMHFAGWLASGGESWWRKTLSTLRYATPTFYWTDLLHPHASHYAVSVLAYCGFAIAFLAMAWLILRARDV